MSQNIIEINTNALIHNLNKIKSQVKNSKIITVVKSDAYGHGLLEISKILRQQGVEWLAVAYVEEAIRIRLDNKDDGRIILLVPPSIEDVKRVVDYDIDFVCDNIDVAKAINEYSIERNKNSKLHISVNTGMNREGVHESELVDFALKLKTLSNIDIVGYSSHLAASEVYNDFGRNQINIFNQGLNKLEKININPNIIHIGNSGSIFNYNNENLTHVRTGIALYGYSDFELQSKKIGLMPVLSLKSKVISIKKIKKDETVGYSFLFKAEKDLEIAIIPIGYGDGYFRNLSNKSFVLVGGHKCNVIGSVCMDQLIIDVTDLKVTIGDEVVLIGSQKANNISAYDLSNLLGTIPYEILTNLSKARAVRVIV